MLTFVILAGRIAVGAVTLKRFSDLDQSVELAYWIGKDHRKNGYASKAARLAIQYSFERLSRMSIKAHFLAANNPVSGKLLSSLGFTADESRDNLPVEGHFAARFPGDHWYFVNLDRPDGGV